MTNRRLIEEWTPFLDPRRTPPRPLTRQRLVEDITDGEAKPPTAADRLKAQIREILASDRKRSIELERIAEAVKNAQPPRDQDAAEADVFNVMLESLKKALDSGDDEAAKVNAIAELVDVDEAALVRESFRDRPGRDEVRDLVEAITGSNDRLPTGEVREFAASIRD